MDQNTTILTFIEKIHEYADVYSYLFTPSEPVAFTAGSYAHLRITSLPETVRRVREISFASSPQDAIVQFGIDGRSQSDYQKALQALTPGDTIEMFKIKSHMTWPPDIEHAVMIAGGVGVTPFRAMLRDKFQNERSIKTTLLHAAAGTFLYEKELRDLSDEYIISDRNSLPEALDRIMTEHHDAHYYIAGSPDFVASITDKLAARGISRIENDPFKGLSDDLA